MGKVKSNKKHKVGEGQDQYISQRQSAIVQQREADTLQLSELEDNLGSMDEVKRKQACILLADLYQFNAANGGSLDALSSKKILMKLGMRLIDHSLEVRSSASLALKNLTESGNRTIQNRVLCFGMLRSIMQLIFELAPVVVTQPQHTFTLQNYLYTVANLVNSSPEVCQEVAKSYPNFVSILVATLSTAEIGLNLTNTIANLLIELIKTPCLGIFTVEHLVSVQSMLSQHMVNRVTAVGVNMTAVETDPFVIIIQLIEVLALFHIKQSTEANTGLMTLSELLNILLSVFKALVSHPDLLIKDSPNGVKEMEVEEASVVTPSTTTPTAASPSSSLWTLLDMTSDVCSSLATLPEDEIQINHAALRILCTSPLSLSLLQSLSPLRQIFSHHTEKDSHNNVLISPTGIQTLLIIEKVLAAGSSLFTRLKEWVEQGGMQGENSSLLLSCLQLIREQATWQLEAVLGVSSKEGEGCWKVGEDLSQHNAPMKSCVLNSAQLSHELLQLTVQMFYVLVPALPQEECKELSGLLMKWMQVPQLEIQIWVISNISSLTQPTHSSFPANFHTLLTNALLNRCASPQAFSIDPSQEELSQRDNLHLSSILLMDACLNALMDMHSSDDPQHLSAFVKINAGTKIVQLRQDLRERCEVYKGKLLKGEDCEKVEETLENLTNFIQYKEQSTVQL